MEQLPNFWRNEIWHPLSVHFPIALLIFATLFKIIGLKFNKAHWRKGAFILLLFGTAGAWISVFTGNIADSEVAREVCDPTVLEEHENISYIVAWLFSIASIIELLIITGLLKFKLFILRLVIALLMLTGSGFLAYTGHLGATLVYQQAAGVYHPSEDCSEFE